MKRRDFLKLAAASPIGLATIQNSCEPLNLNGTIWETPNGIRYLVLFDVTDPRIRYKLASLPYETSRDASSRTAMMICHRGGDGSYTEQELRKELTGWKYRPDLEVRVYNKETQTSGVDF